MLKNIRNHEAYLNFIVEQLNNHYPSKKFLKDLYFDQIIWCSLLDLTETAALHEHRYSSNPRGRKPRNPCDMLRSLILMHKQKVTSADKWVFILKTSPILATFYDFFTRLWLNPSPHLSSRKKIKLKRPKKKGKKNQKLEPKNPNIIEKLVNRALKNKNNRYK